MKMRSTSLAAVMGLTLCTALTLPTLGQPQAAGPEAAIDESQPRAVYHGFMRPPGPGPDYNTWDGAQGPDIDETDADPARLPSRVDNSERPEFPPIYRQRFGTCGQYTSVASMLTYEMNVAFGTTAQSEANRFPATFSWNMINGAQNRGSEAYHGWEVAKHIGIPTIESYGTVEHQTLGAWPNGYDVWRDAMNNRVAGYRYTPAQTVAQLNEARGWLFDRNRPDVEGTVGGLLALDGRMGSLGKVTRTIPEGAYEAGQDVWTRWGPDGYGHGITCAGYDDNVGYDVNNDGQITNDIDINGDGQVTLADWERGAYIVVNSWGQRWSGDGKIYLLYSAMIDPTWRRGNYLGRVEVARHVPRMTMRLVLACDDRTDLRMTVGLAGDSDAAEPAHTHAPQAFNGWPIFGRRSNPGHVPLAGPDDPTPLEVGIDLTPLLDELGPDADGRGKVFLSLSRADGSEATGELHEAAVRFYDAEGQFIEELPIAIEDGVFGESTLRLNLAVDGLPTE